MTATPPLEPQLKAPSKEESAAASPAVRSAARWFWWIAGLSLVNIFMSQSENGANFVAGLGLTSIVDAMFATNPSTGYAIDAAILGFFVVVGLQGLKGKLWAFYAGVAVYILDALIFLLAQEWIPVAFHGLVIYFIVRGALELQNALKASDNN